MQFSDVFNFSRKRCQSIYQSTRWLVPSWYTPCSECWCWLLLIIWNRNLLPLIEGLLWCSSNPYTFEFSVFGGIEPTTEGLTVPRSNQIRYFRLVSESYVSSKTKYSECMDNVESTAVLREALCFALASLSFHPGYIDIFIWIILPLRVGPVKVQSSLSIHDMLLWKKEKR